VASEMCVSEEIIHTRRQLCTHQKPLSSKEGNLKASQANGTKLKLWNVKSRHYINAPGSIWTYCS